MLTKRLTKIGDSTGMVIDRPILDLLGLDRGDEVRFASRRARSSSSAPTVGAAEKRRAKIEKAKARMHANIGTTLRKLAR